MSPVLAEHGRTFPVCRSVGSVTGAVHRAQGPSEPHRAWAAQQHQHPREGQRQQNQDPSGATGTS